MSEQTVFELLQKLQETVTKLNPYLTNERMRTNLLKNDVENLKAQKAKLTTENEEIRKSTDDLKNEASGIIAKARQDAEKIISEANQTRVEARRLKEQAEKELSDALDRKANKKAVLNA